MTTKTELEDEIASLVRSKGWYAGAYRRLKIKYDLLEARTAEFEIDLESKAKTNRVLPKPTRKRAERERKRRQAELLEKRLDEGSLVPQPLSQLKDDEERMDKLIAAVKRLRVENEELKRENDGLKRKLDGSPA